MAEDQGSFKLKKSVPPFGTPESPIWEFGYDEQIRVVGGLCTVKSPAMRDRLLKMGYELAGENEKAPDGSQQADEKVDGAEATTSSTPPAAPEPVNPETPPATSGAPASSPPVPGGNVDPAAAPEG